MSKEEYVMWILIPSLHFKCLFQVTKKGVVIQIKYFCKLFVMTELSKVRVVWYGHMIGVCLHKDIWRYGGTLPDIASYSYHQMYLYSGISDLHFLKFSQELCMLQRLAIPHFKALIMDILCLEERFVIISGTGQAYCL